MGEVQALRRNPSKTSSSLIPVHKRNLSVVKHKLSSYSKEKGDPRWGAAGAQKEDAEADNIVIGADRFVLKGNHHRVFSHSPA